VSGLPRRSPRSSSDQSSTIAHSLGSNFVVMVLYNIYTLLALVNSFIIANARRASERETSEVMEVIEMSLGKTGSSNDGDDRVKAVAGCHNPDSVVGEWRATKTELMRVTVRLYGGHPRIDVRRWFYDASGKLCPGIKGVSLTPEGLKRLRKALRKAQRQIERRGLK